MLLQMSTIYWDSTHISSTCWYKKANTCLKPLSVCGTRCGGALTRNSGQIQPPDVDKDGLFDYGVECAWSLIFEGKTIELHVVLFDLRTANPYTCYDEGINSRYTQNSLYVSGLVLIEFSLTVKAATLIFISGGGSTILSAKEEKSGFIYNLVKS